MVARPHLYVASTLRHNAAIDKADKRIRANNKAEWKKAYREAVKKFRNEHMEEHDRWRRIYLEELKEEQAATDLRKDRVVSAEQVSIRRFPCPTCGAEEAKPCRTRSGAWVSPHVARKNLNVYNSDPKRKVPQGRQQKVKK